MGIIEAVIMGVIEGVTEFLPISSTAHLTIAEKIFGHPINSSDITAFTAIIQVGAVMATLVYFRKDIWRIVIGWLRGMYGGKDEKKADYRFGWAVIIGSIPIGIVGLLFKDQIEHNLRSLWLVGLALIIWSGVMWLADRTARQDRHERQINWRDTLFIGTAQCLALIPGVSRAGATMSAGLFRGLDRVAVTRLSFFLSIPALTAAGLQQATSEWGNISSGVGWPATLTATVTSFFVAYLAIAWLLRYVAHHNFNLFIGYRIVLGAAVIILLAAGITSAT